MFCILHVKAWKIELPAYAYHVEVNIADGTYELHPTPKEEHTAELHHVGAEPEPDQDPEDLLTFSEPEDKPQCMNTYIQTYSMC